MISRRQSPIHASEMDDTLRWKSTLMGWEFWRMEEENNIFDDDVYSGYPAVQQRKKNKKQKKRTQSASSAHIIEHEIQKKPFFRHRRSSMTDAHMLNVESRSDSMPTSTSRFFDFGRRARSRSPAKVLLDHDNNNNNRPGRPLFRSPFGHNNRSSSKRQGSVASSVVSSTLDVSVSPPQALGSSAKPLLYFRGGACWQFIERGLDTLCLDLFWPIREDTQPENDMFHIEDLAPLCSFRGLRVLKLTGMMQSYQKYIWQAAWLNVDLEELELEMALEPCIRRNFDGDWPSIKGDWRPRMGENPQPVYHGHYGDGTLHRSIGVGEYLDKAAIEKGKILAAMMGPTRNRLSIVTLTLTGFVVDADPFYLWFNPGRLRRIHFRNDCVDAGFCLPEAMRGVVTIDFPRQVREYATTIRPVDGVREVKVVEVKKKEKAWERQHPGYGVSIWDVIAMDNKGYNEENSRLLDDYNNDDEDIAVFPEAYQTRDLSHTGQDTKSKSKAKNKHLKKKHKQSNKKQSTKSLRHMPSQASTLASSSPRRRSSGALLYGRRAIVRLPGWWWSSSSTSKLEAEAEAQAAAARTAHGAR